ncbi:MAG: DUF192 domain-containing protein [Candidatus Eremiobacteraeota bacterium]|nr:DUF192 domain-containing protein [Candidatus Eremiobacteraeota bacterium]
MIAALALAFTLQLVSQTIEVAAPNETLTLEVADTYASRQYGLMNRTLVPAKHGMIFVFDRDAERYFWMKNTLVPLDMIFILADGTVSSVAANVPASTTKTPDSAVAQRRGNGKFVIELRAGEAERAGLHAGTKLEIPKLEPRD